MSPREPLIGMFFAFQGVAFYMDGRYDDAVRWARQAAQLRPGYLGAHRILSASLAQAGQLEEARAAMRTLRQLQPNISIEWIRQSLPYTGRVIDRFIEGMRKAGLT